MAAKHAPCLLTQKKGSRLLKSSAWGHFFLSPTGSTRPNDWVQSKIMFLVGPQKPLLATFKRQKLAGFRHVTRHNSLSKTILQQGTFGVGGHCDQLRKCWMDNVKEWTPLPMPELLTRASCRRDWRRISAESSLVSPWWPSQSRDWTELNWTGEVVSWALETPFQWKHWPF